MKDEVKNIITSQKRLRTYSLLYKFGIQIYMDSLFGDTTTNVSDDHIIRERKQEVDGRTFVVRSAFDLNAGKTVGDKLLALVESDIERISKNALTTSFQGRVRV